MCIEIDQGYLKNISKIWRVSSTEYIRNFWNIQFQCKFIKNLWIGNNSLIPKIYKGTSATTTNEKKTPVKKGSSL